MTKFSCLATFTALYFHSGFSWANPVALELLLLNGQSSINAPSACEPYQAELAESVMRVSPAPKTLSQDIATVLTEMMENPVNIESACEALPDKTMLCKVIFSVNESELEWSRVYQFTSPSKIESLPALNDLKCFNLP
jgi:hypothetical protein